MSSAITFTMSPALEFADGVLRKDTGVSTIATQIEENVDLVWSALLDLYGIRAAAGDVTAVKEKLAAKGFSVVHNPARVVRVLLAKRSNGAHIEWRAATAPDPTILARKLSIWEADSDAASEAVFRLKAATDAAAEANHRWKVAKDAAFEANAISEAVFRFKAATDAAAEANARLKAATDAAFEANARLLASKTNYQEWTKSGELFNEGLRIASLGM